jgi:hypothetical protein
VKAQVTHRHGRLRLKRPGCACKMNRIGNLTPCFYHFGAPGGIRQSRKYLLRAWYEYDMRQARRSGDGARSR